MGEIGNFWILLQRLNFGVSRNYFQNDCFIERVCSGDCKIFIAYAKFNWKWNYNEIFNAFWAPRFEQTFIQAPLKKKNRKKNEKKMPHSFKCIWVFRNIISNRITTSIGMPTVEILKANPIYTIHLNSIHINTPKQHKWHTLPALPTLSHRLLSLSIFCLFYFLCCCCCFVLFCIFGNLDSFLFFFE